MNEILTVAELTQAIKMQLESRFPVVAVKGELINLKEQSSGHLYFTLKDQEAQISCVLFRGNSRELSRLPKQGDQVIVRGELSLYAPRGSYQLIIRKLEFLGVGELLMQLHALKGTLEKRGWFDSKRKKPLPKFPKTIGVVTSPTGSVIQDILHVLSRRLSGFHLILNPVKVQGEGAAQEIARAIEEFNRYALADLLIVGRGGGSLEDLFAFNEECVAAAIYHSRIPVISAVGHETDVSIADFVADVRAPTPSAAAEIATGQTVEQLKFLQETKNQLFHVTRTRVRHLRERLYSIKKHPCLASPYSLLEPHMQRVDDFRADLKIAMGRRMQEARLKLAGAERQALLLKPSTRISHLREHLNRVNKGIAFSMERQLLEKKEKLSHLSSYLKGIDPKNLLTKGYCIPFLEKTDSVILSVKEFKAHDKVSLLFHDGKASLTVDKIEEK
jgi:exodeoxyribonuclease VII large subunit